MFNLYVLETCPYCQKVIGFLDECKISYDKHVVTNPDSYSELIRLGGIEQVPFLYDKENGVKMYESDDIIAYITSMIR